MQTAQSHIRRSGVPAMIAALVVLSAFALLANGVIGRVPIILEGQRSSIDVGASVRETLAEHPSLAATGDIVAASDGRVVLTGGGRAPHVSINGRPATLDAPVAAGDTIDIEPGADTIEPTEEETRVIAVPAKVVGQGAILTMVSAGASGVQRVVVGALSGDIVASETVVPAEPMILRRMGGGGKKVVALTFDDGPWPGQTEQVLKILKDERVPATFFVIGRYVKRNPKLVARIAAEGHDIGNHTYNHVDVSTTDPKTLQREIAGTNAEIRRAGVETPTWFRPPMGRVSEPAYSVMRSQKVRPVLWTVDPQDWRDDRGAYQMTMSVVAAVRPGGVILLHDGGGTRSETIKALPWIIHELRNRGYEFVLLDDLPQAPKARW